MKASPPSPPHGHPLRIRRWPARFAAAAGLSWLLAALVLLALCAGAASGVRAAGLPADSAEEPLAPPAPLAPGRIDPDHGLQFGLGLPYTVVTSDALDVRLEGGTLTSTGAIVNLDAAVGPFRIGYVRQLYRRPLPEGTQYRGSPVDFLSFDSDELWAFHGFRPVYPLYLAYGLGWRHRLVRLLVDNAVQTTERESQFAAGLMVDYAVALPFTLQLRYTQDLSGTLVRQQSLALHLTYVAPF